MACRTTPHQLSSNHFFAFFPTPFHDSACSVNSRRAHHLRLNPAHIPADNGETRLLPVGKVVTSY
jgi:hypothetical protein